MQFTVAPMALAQLAAGVALVIAGVVCASIGAAPLEIATGVIGIGTGLLPGAFTPSGISAGRAPAAAVETPPVGTDPIVAGSAGTQAP